jgi:hypothetical protein
MIRECCYVVAGTNIEVKVPAKQKEAAAVVLAFGHP